MADETPQAEPQAQSQQTEQPQGQSQGNEPGPVPYERFKALNDELKTLRAAQEKAQAERKTAQEKELAEQQKWQQLYEQRETELKAERTNNLKMQVALEKGLPADLISRLQGDDAESLAKDADTLLQFIKPASGPGVPPGGRNSQAARLDINNMTPKQIRENKDALYRQQ